MKKTKFLNLLATSIQSSANLGKYVLSFDPKAINLVTWYRFIGQSILYYQVENRDKEIEDISSQRQEINKNWEQLL